MTQTLSRPTEMALPAAALTALRNALTAELGADVAARVLRNAGHDAGDAFFQILSSDGSSAAGRDALAQLDATAFWRRFAQLFSSRGWGSLAHGTVHPGIAVLSDTERTFVASTSGRAAYARAMVCCQATMSWVADMAG